MIVDPLVMADFIVAGVLAIDFGCQNSDLRTKFLKDIQCVFDEVYVLKVQGLVNEIVFAIPHPEKTERESKLFEVLKSVKDIQKFGEASKKWNEETDLCEIMKDLVLL